ncbi:MAG: CapA family protein [Oscillospiraceae bacterium]|nr:CapA family protein [Oscillospiraceae bacterium]
MNRFLIGFCKLLAVVGLFVLVAVLIFSPRWAARPEDVRVAAPTPLPTPVAAPTAEAPAEAALPAAAVPEPTPAPTPAPTPEPTATPEPEPTPIVYTISLVGDCTLASYPKIRNWETSIENVVNGNWAYPFSHTAELFRQDDLTLANLECSISDQQAWSASTFSFLAPSDAVNILTEGGVEYAGMANNHAMDFGQAIYDDTAANLDAAGIAHGGDGEGVLVTTESGLTVGIYTAYSGHYPSAESVAAGVTDLKNRGAEIVIVYAHWGDEASYYTNANQTAAAHAAIDAGATIVAGHGPHRLQPYEEYGGGVIFYSLANFVFGGNTQPEDMDTVIAQVQITRELDGTLHLSGAKALPASISSQSPLNDYCPTLWEQGSAEYDRAMSKVDGSWNGANSNIDYSFMHTHEIK